MLILRFDKTLDGRYMFLDSRESLEVLCRIGNRDTRAGGTEAAGIGNTDGSSTLTGSISYSHSHERLQMPKVAEL